ncbi:ribokinase [Propionibacterium freudenreichii]|uniref:ribokinase n=1 Tax=Propionibacterium freudenreichii TaxID=1744 RepID=UPI0005A5CE1A|nr:ribokinase [Propionibacterium freudenreichii]MCT3001208.1 ribokinase [Propionibacterium freudenreichii]MDK9348348.1 ribokinase [Propionibacterium freudenreichii]MDK9627749.1 ribokinase [Propionibacterium freudenreichii]MDK9652630.1 ribokinase [Propionibacterium freudenreichii]CEI31876.1 carbohydrate or pyrimidine kinases PfkB family [Propionibacterium freudenreichii]
MRDPSSSAPEVRAAARAARSALERVTNRRGRVGVLGSLNADLTVTTRTLPGPGETVVGDPLVVRPGGKSANQAVACALAGADTLMVGAVGDDAHGEMLRESLTRAGVDISGVRSAQVATGTAVITVDHRGENTIVVSAGANGTLGADDVHDAADALRAVSVLGLCLEVSDPALLAAQRLVNSAGGTTVLNVSPLREVSAELVADAQVLIVNEHELAAVVGSDPGREPADIAAALDGHGIGRAVVTLGAQGSVAVEAGLVVSVPAFPVQAIDTTGAGDAFMGTLMAAIAAEVPLGEGAALASAFAAVAVTRRGAQASYPGQPELQEFLARW